VTQDPFFATQRNANFGDLGVAVKGTCLSSLPPSLPPSLVLTSLSTSHPSLPPSLPTSLPPSLPQVFWTTTNARPR